MATFNLNLEKLTCISSSFGFGADEIMLASRLWDSTATPNKLIKDWTYNGPYVLNSGQSARVPQPLWQVPVPTNPYPDKLMLEMWMLKQEAFLQASHSTNQPPPVNVSLQNNQNVTITITGPTIPGVSPPGVQISFSPKGLMSLLLEGIVGHFEDNIGGPQIALMQQPGGSSSTGPQGVQFLHRADNRKFGKWGSEFIIEYDLSVVWP